MARRKIKLQGGEVPLPVTPMLDMTFQLLFFFIATYKPATAVEGQIEMALPSMADVAAQDQKKADPKHSEDIVDVPATFTIEIKAERGPDAKNPGAIRFLTIRGEAGKQDFTIDQNLADAEVSVRVKDMFNQVRKKLQDAKNTRVKKDNEKDTVRIMADGNTKWDQVMKVIDLCTELGFQASFIPPPPE